MNYVNFRGVITAKVGLIDFGWPLPALKSPSNMTHMEAKVVLRAFESGAAGFCSLKDDEWCDWLTAHYASQVIVVTEPQPSDSSESEPAPIPAPKADNTATAEKRPAETSEDRAQQKRARTDPVLTSAVSFINSGVPLDGGNFVVPKARKPRKDRGEKRGPYKQRGDPQALNSENQPVAGSVPPPKKQPRPRKAKKIADPAAPAPATAPVITPASTSIIAPTAAPTPASMSIIAPAPAPVIMPAPTSIVAPTTAPIVMPAPVISPTPVISPAPAPIVLSHPPTTTA